MPVSARFHAARDKTLAAVDKVFAEPVLLSFMANEVLDPERPAIQIDAPLRTEKAETSSVEGGRARTWKSRIAAAPATLKIDMATYDGPMPRQGDKVRALSRKGQPWFAVVNVNDRHHARLNLELAEA